MKRISMDKLKVILRDQGIKVKPSYDKGSTILCSSALKQTQVDWIGVKSRSTGTFKSSIINRLIHNFQPVQKDVNAVLKYDEGRSMAGFLNRRVGKEFGSRKYIKFTSFQIDKHNYRKLNELAEYYSISRSAVIRGIVEEAMLDE